MAANSTQPVSRHIVDPTKNVLDLVEAKSKSSSELREADLKRIDAEHQTFTEHIKEIMVANDKRYEQRFEAQQKALDAAFAAQKDAVNAAMVSQKESAADALSSQERAVAKSEIAFEKRFEAAERARLEQAEQQRTLMPRTEAEKSFSSQAEKIGVLEGFRTEQLSKGVGSKEGYGYAIGVIGLIMTILSIISVGIMIATRLT